jgi:hypothetical protein
MNLATPRRAALVSVALVAAGFLAGCSTLVGRPTRPLLAKRDEPGVVLCLSQRSASGGIRLVGRLEPGIYPIRRAAIEYRTAAVSDAVPAVAGERGVLELGGRTEKVPYRAGMTEVTFDVGPDAARSLRDKVLWYRWIVEYDRGGSLRTDRTDIHRTSYDEAGLPRAAGNPGPDASVVSSPAK